MSKLAWAASVVIALAITPAADAARLGQISIPFLNLYAPIHEGVSSDSLAFGPGHYPSTSLPGQPGTIGIAGHRTTQTRPFGNIHSLKARELIVVATRNERFAYRVSGMRIVKPEDVWVLRSPNERLVLTACHPPGSAALRLIVFADRIHYVSNRQPTREEM